MFTFFIRNDVTNEVATFLGQGETMDVAWKDALKNLKEPWRPSSSGGGNEHNHVVQPLNVRLPNGKRVSRPQAEFEGDAKHPEQDKP